jgi:ABC-type transport system substrate-binding protein
MKHYFRALPLVAITAILLLNSCSSTPPPAAVRIRWAHDPETLDPLILPNQQAIDVINLIYCSLLQVDFSRREFSPLLAEAMPAVQHLGDSLTLLHYQLRPAAAWDGGQPVLARDVDFTLKLMFCPGLPNEGARTQYSFIREFRIDAADPRRFTLVCRGQAPEYAQASGDFPIISEAALDPQGQLRRFSLAALQNRAADTPADSTLAGLARRYLTIASGQGPTQLAGCGPYQLMTWEKDRFLRFQRKAQWWGNQVRPLPFVLQARPKQLEFVIIPDDATATLALQRGELDVYPQVPAREFARLQQSAATRKALAFYTAASYDVVTAGFNTRRPALADPATRRALSYLFDAGGLLKATQLGQGRRTVGLINPTDRANYNNSLPLIPYDVAGAAALLRRAGWQQQPSSPAGWQRRGRNDDLQQLTLRLRYRADEAAFETIALQFRAAAAQLGIPVTLHPTESSALTPTLQSGDFDLYIRTLKGNPFIFNFAPILHSQAVGKGNLTGYGTPTSDQLIEAVAAADTPARKAKLLHQLQAQLQADMPLVPLFFLPTRIAADRHLSGLHVTGLKPGYAAAAIDRVAQPQPAL